MGGAIHTRTIPQSPKLQHNLEVEQQEPFHKYTTEEDNLNSCSSATKKLIPTVRLSRTTVRSSVCWMTYDALL